MFQGIVVAAEEQQEALQRLASQSQMAVGEQQEALQRLTSQSQMAVGEVHEELLAFMGEQRVFCGFLDAEQKSNLDLMRPEVSALSRLVDSTLRSDRETEDNLY